MATKTNYKANFKKAAAIFAFCAMMMGIGTAAAAEGYEAPAAIEEQNPAFELIVPEEIEAAVGYNAPVSIEEQTPVFDVVMPGEAEGYNHPVSVDEQEHEFEIVMFEEESPEEGAAARTAAVYNPMNTTAETEAPKAGNFIVIDEFDGALLNTPTETNAVVEAVEEIEEIEELEEIAEEEVPLAEAPVAEDSVAETSAEKKEGGRRIVIFEEDGALLEGEKEEIATIEEIDVPMAALPTEEFETVVEADEPEAIDILDIEVPLTDIPDEAVPQTGDTAVWYALFAVAVIGLASVTVMGRKKNNEA